MSFCGACGAPVSTASARFCAGCGAALAAQPLAPPSTVAPSTTVAPVSPAAHPLIARGPTPTPPPPPMLPPLKAAKKTNSGAFVVGFLSVMLLAGGITVMVMRDDAASPSTPLTSDPFTSTTSVVPSTSTP